MTKLKNLPSFVITAAICILLPFSETIASPADNMSGSSLNANIIVLSPGHSRTIFFELHDTVYNDVNAVHAAFIMTVGSGVLTVSVANSTPMGEGSEIIYATSGFIGLTPVLDYSYGSAPISFSVPTTDSAINFGLLLTGVVAKIGNPDFPVTVSMTFLFTP